MWSAKRFSKALRCAECLLIKAADCASLGCLCRHLAFDTDLTRPAPALLSVRLVGR
jgi:hypothetical protein